MKVFFPYRLVRDEQALLMNDFADCLKSGKVLVAQAPTGLGKTISGLAPAISFARENKKKIFFLTPKSSQHQIVIETVRLINSHFGLNIKAIDFVGKRQMCLEPFVKHIAHGFYEACESKKDSNSCFFYSNTFGKNPASKTKIKQKRAIVESHFNNSFSKMKEKCEDNHLCPYEIALEMSKHADIIVCDYAHLFNPEIREKILSKSGIALSDCIVIVDEAHNLPHRLRDIQSSTLSIDALEKAGKEARSIGSFEVESLIKDLGKEIVSFGKKLSFNIKEASLSVDELSHIRALFKGNEGTVYDASLKYMTKYKTEACFLLSVWEFMHSISVHNEDVLFAIERKQSLRLGYYPMDIEVGAGKLLNSVHSGLLMSGTMLPLEMYSDVLGIRKAVLKEYQSPFPKENRVNLLVKGATTKYSSRGEKQFSFLANNIERIASKVPGNIVVFFPSFDLLETISKKISLNKKVFTQKQEMNNEDKRKILDNFKDNTTIGGNILFAVSGGSLAEGIDFPGDNLLCAIIVGFPFARTSIHSNALITHYEKRFKKGFEYGYSSPAMNKALQAAGRVIRSEKERGVCVFLDERFGESQYTKFFPKGFVLKETITPEKETQEFFLEK